MTIATTIIAQLGGNRFTSMTGAKSFVMGERSLTFRFGRNASKSNMVKITLNGDDTYTVQFYRLRGIDCAPTYHVDSVHADGLREAFTAHTGMITAL